MSLSSHVISRARHFPSTRELLTAFFNVYQTSLAGARYLSGTWSAFGVSWLSLSQKDFAVFSLAKGLVTGWLS